MSRRATLWGLAVFIALLTVTRLGWLGVRLPHHDEMVHDSISIVLARSGAYEARPAYHGPLLYHLQAAAYAMLGHGMWQGRLVPALAGIGAVLALVALVRRQFGTRRAIVVAVLALVSPSLLYYSRFDAHDTLILAMTVLLSWSVQWWIDGRHERALLWGTIALGAAWATKLNSLFLGGALVSFVVLWRLSQGGRLTREVPARGTWRVAIDPIALALVSVSLLFFTTWLALRTRHGWGEGAWRTLLRATIDPVLYWAGQHQRQRLAGPFEYYTEILLVYEPLVLVGAVAALAQAWIASGWRRRRAFDLLAVGAVLAGVLLPFAAYVEKSLRIHPWFLAVLPLAAAAWTLAWRRAVAEGHPAQAWWLWMMATQFGLYGFAGEKVPWLVVHVMLPMSVVASGGLVAWWEAAHTPRRRLDAGLTLALGLTVAVLGAFAVTTYHRSSPIEPMVQLEYPAETQAALAEAARVCRWQQERPCLATSRQGRWLVEWHFVWHAPARVHHAVHMGNARIPFAFLPEGMGAARLSATHTPRRLVLLDGTNWRMAFTRGDLRAILGFVVRRAPLGPPQPGVHELWTRNDLVPALAPR